MLRAASVFGAALSALSYKKGAVAQMRQPFSFLLLFVV